jgi:hypothetical protein
LARTSAQLHGHWAARSVSRKSAHQEFKDE